MKRIFTLILFVAAVGIFANAQELTVYTTNMTPVMDGYIDDIDDPWGSDWVELGLVNDNSTTGGDYSAQFKLLQNADYLFLGIKVQDATPETGMDNSYENDCAEIFMSMETPADDGAYKEGTWQFRAQRIENDVQTLGYFDGNSGANTWSVASMTDSGDFMWGTDDSGTEYVWELGFPKAVLAGESAFDGEQIWFDIAVADNSGGGRTGQRYWFNNTDGQWNNASLFANVALSAEITTGNDELTVKGSAFVKNEMLQINNVEGEVNIFNLRGALVQSAVVNGSASINISGLNSGMYIVKGNNLTAKVVK